ncbi:hypothetical protein SFRURICE_020869, partial [Spodoptera frugiperda]
MTVGESCDIDGHELYEELNMFIRVYEGNDDIISVLKYIIEKKLTEVYPTIEIVLRIIATTPVTVASAEKSFSRPKIIIYNRIPQICYLRNSMTQDRLSALAILSIENDVAHSLDYSVLIKNFSLRKIFLVKHNKYLNQTTRPTFASHTFYEGQRASQRPAARSLAMGKAAAGYSLPTL